MNKIMQSLEILLIWKRRIDKEERGLKQMKTQQEQDRLIDKNEILKRLSIQYADAKPALTYRNAFELLIAVMLSAQCTDKRVNIVTEQLFQTLCSPEDFANLTPEELTPMIRSCGLSNTKARNIIATCKRLVADFGSKVPSDIDTLQTLPGVGRKTANVVASVAFGVPAIAVDTHVFRVANRTGLVVANNVLDTEKQLQEVIPKEDWSKAHHWLIFHGRQFCTARSPKCESCFLSDICAKKMS